MRKILVLNAKGGSGKSTIATNLASALSADGKRVALLDCDPQESSMEWLAQRPDDRPEISGYAAHSGAVKIPGTTDYLVIDSPAALQGKELAYMLRRAESIIIPVLPSPIDMRAAEKFIETMKNSTRIGNKQAKMALVGNRVRTYTNIFGELESFLKKKRIPVLTQLRDSMNYTHSAESGIGIHEMAPYATRIDREQWTPILKWIKSKRSQP